MPSSEPATAVASSQRTISPPMSARRRGRQRDRRELGAFGRAAALGRRTPTGADHSTRARPPTVGRALQPLLARDRKDALAVLAGRLGDELLEPRTEELDLRRRKDREQIVTRAGASVASRTPSATPGLVGGLDRRPRLRGGVARRAQQRVEVARAPRRRAPARTETTPRSVRRSPARRGTSGSRARAPAPRAAFRDR